MKFKVVFNCFVLNMALYLSISAAALEFSPEIINLTFMDKIQGNQNAGDFNEKIEIAFYRYKEMLPIEKTEESYDGAVYTLIFQSENKLNLSNYIPDFFEKKNIRERPLNSRILGIDNQTALKFSGYTHLEAIEGNNSCSDDHIQGDISNTWCHAGISKLVYKLAVENGVSEALSQLGGVSVFLVKEATDKNYDWSDVTTAPIKVIDKCHMTFALDGSAYLECLNRF